MYSHFRWFLSPRISFLNCASWFPFSVHYGSRKLCTMVPDFCASLFAEGCALLFPDYRGQSLSYHPHVHVLVPAGGLDADGQQWVMSSKKFFVPVKALSKIFRAAFYQLLKNALQREKLRLPDQDLSLYKIGRASCRKRG